MRIDNVIVIRFMVFIFFYYFFKSFLYYGKYFMYMLSISAVENKNFYGFNLYSFFLIKNN